MRKQDETALTLVAISIAGVVGLAIVVTYWETIVLALSVLALFIGIGAVAFYVLRRMFS